MIKDKNTNIIIREAKKLGLRVKVLQEKRKFLELSIGRKKFLLQRDFRINIDRFGTRNIPLFKDLTYLLWKREKIPIPRTTTAFSLQEAKRKLKEIPRPWVIKQPVRKLLRNLGKIAKCEITIDEDLKNLIKLQGYSLDSVLSKNKKIYIRERSSLSEGGKIRSVPIRVHPHVKQMCLRATKAVGLELGGLDIIAENLSMSPQSQRLKFIEINGRPDLWLHHLPDEGKPVNVTREILKYIFFNSHHK